MTSREAAVLVLLRVEEGAYATDVLDDLLRKEKFSDVDKRFLWTLVFGTLERKLTLDFLIARHIKKSPEPVILQILRVAVYQMVYLEKVPVHTAIDEGVKLCPKFKKTSAKGFVNGVLRSLQRGGFEIDFASITPLAKRFSVEYSVAQEIVEDLLADWGEAQVRDLLATGVKPPQIYARVNRQEISREALIERLSSEGVEAREAMLPDAILLPKVPMLTELESFLEGLFHIQDLSSQLCAETLSAGISEGIIFDLCAAPGGKTFTVAENVPSAKIYAFDQSIHKIEKMKEEAKRLSLSNVKMEVSDATVFRPDLPQADRVLCDVPCSGFGVIAKKPEIKYKKRSEYGGLPAIQLAILKNASRYVKPGGTLIYATCTVLRSENEQVVERFLAEETNFCFAPLPQTLAPAFHKGNESYATIFPAHFNADGFFLAALCKKK